MSYLSLFDKTLLKVDNFYDQQIADHSKFFTLRLSSFEIKIEFLYKRKLWSIQQSVVWKSEWTMLTLTWQEFEGLSLYVNSVRLLCQQTFEYYSPNEQYSSSKMKVDKYKRSQIYVNNTYGSILFIGINNKLVSSNFYIYDET